MWIPDFVLKLIGKEIGSKLDLQEGPMNDTKKWFQSKTIWTAVVTGLIGIYNVVAISVLPAFGHTAPAIPDFIFTILGAIGVYTRATATTQISS